VLRRRRSTVHGLRVRCRRTAAVQLGPRRPRVSSAPLPRQRNRLRNRLHVGDNRRRPIRDDRPRRADGPMADSTKRCAGFDRPLDSGDDRQHTDTALLLGPGHAFLVEFMLAMLEINVTRLSEPFDARTYVQDLKIRDRRPAKYLLWCKTGSGKRIGAEQEITA
jgi:hypothetical protein